MHSRHMHRNESMFTNSTGTSLAAVHRVPAEILREIFLTLLDITHKPFEALLVGEAEVAQDSITVSHVCQAWRAVAIADQSLWRRISIPGLSNKLVGLYLQRSNDSTLSVGIVDKRDKTALRCMESVDEVFDCMARIGDLRLVTTDFSFGDYTDFLSRPAPRLKSVAVTSNLGYGINILLRMANNIAQSPLHTLKLYSVIAPWTSSMFRGLSTLVIVFPMPPPTINDLLQMLNSAPELVHLTYRDRCLVAMRWSPPYPRISLPGLVSLRLEMYCDNCASLFDHIRMPSLMRWSLRLKCEPKPDHEPHHPIRYVHLPKQFHSLAISSTPDGIQIRATYPSCLDGSTNEIILGVNIFNHPLSHLLHPWRVAGSTFESHFPATSVSGVTLTIRSWILNDVEFAWAALLACFPALRTLAVHLYHTVKHRPRDSLENIAYALTPSQCKEDRPSQCNCPELERVNIEADISVGDWDYMVVILTGCLAVRTDHRLPKIHLRVGDDEEFCNKGSFKARHVRILERVVEKLSWEEPPSEQGAI
ncbi:hypothetical protein BD410DRAFT_826715 [Rickenella mellea]|uniref:Uncharacterized protein n=1 Tax=Rickenella mellea TaxID=50990 RepID=A0A4Y7QCA7_9AGAM|nr:hypothetical protein BD410DRAFT_826715 [Rickenella mellea]